MKWLSILLQWIWVLNNLWLHEYSCNNWILCWYKVCIHNSRQGICMFEWIWWVLLDREILTQWHCVPSLQMIGSINRNIFLGSENGLQRGWNVHKSSYVISLSQRRLKRFPSQLYHIFLQQVSMMFMREQWQLSTFGNEALIHGSK